MQRDRVTLHGSGSVSTESAEEPSYAALRGRTHLKTHFNLLRKGTVRENSLYLRHNVGVNDSAFRANRMNLLFDSSNDGKVVREITGNDTRDPITAEFRISSWFCINRHESN